MKQKKIYDVQDESSVESESASGGWVLKSTPFVVCDIFLERYVTAGVLSELYKTKSLKVLPFNKFFPSKFLKMIQQSFHSSCI